jgi:GT2 family glycosyltransferase
MSAPTVSIVIVNWKTPDLLAGCLDSIRLDARSDSFEILVVDNNSGDNSVEMVRQRYPEVQLVANAENVGFARACNQVIPHAKAPFVLLLNPDTVVVENAVSLMADFMVNNPKCGAVGPKVLNPDGTLQLACRRSFPSPMASFFRLTYLSRLFPKNKTFAQYNLTFADPDQQLEVDALSGSCMMVRKSAIDRIGLLDEDIFMFGEDIDWCWRLKEEGWTVVYAPQAKVFHFHGASSRLRPIGATINLHRGMEVFYRKHMAPKYWAPFNWLVYLSIWSRAAIFIVLSWLKTLLPSRKDVQFAARASSIPQTRVEVGAGRGGKG